MSTTTNTMNTSRTMTCMKHAAGRSFCATTTTITGAGITAYGAYKILTGNSPLGIIGGIATTIIGGVTAFIGLKSQSLALQDSLVESGINAVGYMTENQEKTMEILKTNPELREEIRETAKAAADALSRVGIFVDKLTEDDEDSEEAETEEPENEEFDIERVVPGHKERMGEVNRIAEEIQKDADAHAEVHTRITKDLENARKDLDDLMKESSESM